MAFLGGYASAFHSAETVKSKLWAAAFAAHGFLGAFFAAPQQAYADPAPAIYRSVQPTGGSVPTSQSRFGTHAIALYCAEAAKTQVWKASRGITGPSVTKFFAAAQPPLDLSLQPYFDAPQSKGATPRVPLVILAPPQNVDLTLQAFLDAPQSAAAGAVSRAVYAPPQVVDFSVQPSFDSPQLNPSGYLFSVVGASPDPSEFPTLQVSFTPSAKAQIVASGIISSFFVAQQVQERPTAAVWPTPQSGFKPRAAFATISSPEQVYTNPAPLVLSAAPALSVTGPSLTAQYTFGTHAAATYNAEASKSRVWNSAVTPIVTGRNTQAWLVAGPQSIDLTLQPLFDVPQLNPSGWLVSYVCATPDLTEITNGAASVFAPVTAPLIPGKVCTYFGTLPQLEDRPALAVWRTQVVGATPRIIPTNSVGEQAYANPQPLTVRAAPPVGGPALGSVPIAPQQTYVDVQPRIISAVTAGNLPRANAFFTVPQPGTTQIAPQLFATLTTPLSSIVSPYIRTLAQSDDPASASIWRAQFAVTTASVPSLVQTSGQIHLERQPSFSRPLITGQGPALLLVRVPPQHFDFTLQATFVTPMCAPPVVTPPVVVRIVLDGYGQRIVLPAVYTRITL